MDLGLALKRIGRGATLRLWRLTVADARMITPRVRRLTFTAPDLDELDWTPGEDLVLNLPDAPRRHYTIRDLTDGALAIDFVLHGHGAASTWASTAQGGERIEALGPRGRTRLTDDASWRLFVGDETATPAILAMIEALPPGAKATALLEIQSKDERQAIATAGLVDLEWVVRGGPPGPNDLLLRRLSTLAPVAGEGRAYVLGETSGVRAQRHLLLDLGWPRERITAEGYWRPGRIGGHDHI